MLTLICIAILFTSYVENSSLSNYLKRSRRGADVYLNGTASEDDAFDNAIMEISNNCTCVRYYQCEAKAKSGEGLIDVRFGVFDKCKGGRFFGEFVCCKNSPSGEEANTTPNTNTNSEDGIVDNQTNNNTIEKNKTNVSKTENYTNEGTTTEINRNGQDSNGVKPPKKIKCGYQRPNIDVRILGDDLVPLKGEFPWMAAIFKKRDNKYKFFCSGTLIHPKVVLTSNHYVHRKNVEDFKVVVNGHVELSASDGDKTDDVREIGEIVHHPNYYSGGLYNDAALLILSEPYVIQRNGSINTLCLPPKDVKLGVDRCLVAGWGKGPENPKILKKQDLPLVETSECQRLLRETRLGEHFVLHDSFMCAGGEKGKDACQGDGGSPLMCPFEGEDQYFQMGIVAWGVGCGDSNVPGVYASVPHLTDWITKELEERQLEFD